MQKMIIMVNIISKAVKLLKVLVKDSDDKSTYLGC